MAPPSPDDSIRDKEDLYTAMTGLFIPVTGKEEYQDELYDNEHTEEVVKTKSVSRQTLASNEDVCASEAAPKPSSNLAPSKLELLRDRLETLGGYVGPTTTLEDKKDPDSAEHVDRNVCQLDSLLAAEPDACEAENEVRVVEDSDEVREDYMGSHNDRKGNCCETVEYTVEEVKSSRELDTDLPPVVQGANIPRKVNMESQDDITENKDGSTLNMGVPRNNNAPNNMTHTGPNTPTTPSSNKQAEHITGAALAGGAVGFVVAGSLGGILGAAGVAHLAANKKGKAADLARKCGKKVTKITNKFVAKIERA